METQQISHMQNFYHDVIHCLVRALDYRDPYTRGHSNRVGDMAVAFAELTGLDDERKERIHIAGHLHDIGKIGIPDDVLKKEGSLTEIEWRIMKDHPKMGADIVDECDQLHDVASIILQHHERWDGKGYPKGLKGREICLEARILALCDTIDAMSSNRSYRSRYTWKEIREEIMVNLGRQFDPDFQPYIDPLLAIWMDTYEQEAQAERVG